MPDGAQAWKMIKTPGSHSDRIAQACDRCRSKKIRCDGLRPHCSNCISVGLECKISDRLSRRAFPRGYTESLEDRVRLLEQENNKLMKLLDIRDEEMELLSRVENVMTPAISISPTVDDSNGYVSATRAGHSGHIGHAGSTTTDLAAPSPEVDDYDEPYYAVKQINTLLEDGTYMGSSSGGTLTRTLIEKMKSKKVNDSTIACIAGIAKNLRKSVEKPATSGSQFKPSRISSDRLITIYFQEWHTMFAVLDQELFLQEYESIYNDVVSDSYSTDSLSAVKQIILLLSLSLGSLSTRDAKQKDGNCQESWNLYHDCKRRFTEKLQDFPSIETAQALCLSLLYALHVGNLDDIWHFRSRCVSMSERLGLHRCHKSLRMADGQKLSIHHQRLRRQVFWSINSLDSFAAAALGTARLIHERDIECAAPDSNDNIDPCALAVVRYSQVLASILNTIYSCTDSNHTYRTVVKLEDELESWNRGLDDSLKFKLQHGRPAATLHALHQKSPLLTVLYYYGKMLIHLPAMTGRPPIDGNSESTRISGSNVNVTQSAKMILQCYNYLSSRSVTACIPINPSRLITLYGGIMLYAALDYSKSGSLIQDARSTVTSALKYLQKDSEAQWPGSISEKCLSDLKETCAAVLNAPRRPSNCNTKAAALFEHSTPSEKKVEAAPLKVESINTEPLDGFENWLTYQKECSDLFNPNAYVRGEYKHSGSISSEHTSVSSSDSISSVSDHSTDTADTADVSKVVEDLIGLDGLWRSSSSSGKKTPIYTNEGATSLTMPSNQTPDGLNSHYVSIHSQILRDDETDEDESIFNSQWLENMIRS